MKTKPKPKQRLARQSDRDYAAELVRRYRAKDRYPVLLPDRSVIEWQTVDGDHLALELERFASYGTWQESAALQAARRLSLRGWLRGQVASLRAGKKMTALAAFERIEEGLGIAADTVKDAVYVRKTKKPKARKTGTNRKT